MKSVRLTECARMPRRYGRLHLLHSTVDAYGRAHWLLTERAPGTADPYDALVVTADRGDVYETHLSAVRLYRPRLDALPDGGFVLADTRSKPDEQHVQVFDALGRSSWTFRVGDAIEHLLADTSGALWVGYFDEGVYGDDPLSHPGLRRWSSTGEPLWSFSPGPGPLDMSDCLALNVDGTTAWACPYMHHPLIEVRADGSVRVRTTRVSRVSGLAVDGGRVAFLDLDDVLTYGRITERTVEPEPGAARLVRPDGRALAGRSTVCRGPRIHVRERGGTDWSVLDIGDGDE
ncbi:hypothetical protein OG978_35725 [Streptomyces sp. NBC_01591]|uniref:hypothetical protein n=1 Tax=Streptomyces sp. NBC_01591 TaxID=2975888 RepID=UPI002DD844F0|nr:hypothetical protein [Streptomyces sp. NBC_01591]WSD72282.1 hypothetical protein OG978_35725 [Streptomyces sp. NBC_01591]